jgi:hypothetical protein
MCRKRALLATILAPVLAIGVMTAGPADAASKRAKAQAPPRPRRRARPARPRGPRFAAPTR